jgi:hypothetical protein
LLFAILIAGVDTDQVGFDDRGFLPEGILKNGFDDRHIDAE